MSPLKRRYEEEYDGSIEFDDIWHQECVTPPPRSLVNESQISRSSGRLSFSGGEFLPVDMFPDERCHSPDASSVSTDEHAASEEEEQAERDILNKAKRYLNPGPVLRSTIYFFGERKLLTFFCVHFICTMVVFGKLPPLLTGDSRYAICLIG